MIRNLNQGQGNISQLAPLRCVGDFLLAMESDSTMSTQSQEYIVLVEQLSDEIDSAEQISVQLDEQEGTWLSMTTSLIENLPETAYFHSDLKFTMNENLSHRFTVQDLDIEALKVIASKCVLRYGQASIMSDELLKSMGYPSLQNTSLCTSIENPKEQDVDKSSLELVYASVTPNPISSTAFSVQLNSEIDFSEVQLTISDDKGKAISFTSEKVGNRIEVSLLESSKGLLFIQLFDNSELLSVLKVVRI